MNHSLLLRRQIPLYNGLHEFIGRYDGFILDLWGVIHDGQKPYPGAIKALQKLREEKKRVCLLSNAPRRSCTVVDKLESMGVTRDLYDAIYTSGEAVWEALKNPKDSWHAKLGRKCYHIGGERDLSLFDDQDIERVSSPDQAQFVMNSGIDPFVEELSPEHEAVLAACAARGLPMICANPDLVVNSGNRIIICAGTLAKRYEELSGSVAYHGKPYAGVYARCLELLGVADKKRIVALGDSFHTDMAGAQNAEIDAVFVAGGIHAPDLDLDIANPASRPHIQKLQHLAENAGVRPVGALRLFSA